MSNIAMQGGATGTGTVTLLAPSTSTDRILTLPDSTGTVLNDQSNIEAQVKTATNASGSAPVYACRAWVNFNGTGTVAIRASGNVSSITDNGVGDYTVNFTTALPDANYQVSMSSVSYTNANFSLAAYIKAGASTTIPALKTTTQLTVAYASVSAATYFDCAEMNVAIFR